MIQCKEPFILIAQSELNMIIEAAAKAAAREVINEFSVRFSQNRPASVTQADAARILKKSRPTISRMVKAGVFRLNKLGNIPIEQVDDVLQPNR